MKIFLSSVRLTGAAISDKNPRSFQLTVVFEYFFEFSKNSKNRVFCGCGVCLNADSEACGCGIDMVDGALETLDLTLYERGIVRSASEQ